MYENYKGEKGKIRRFIYQSKQEGEEQFERKMNQDASGNRKMFWKELGKSIDGKVGNCNRIKT